MLVQQLITDARRELLEYGTSLFWSDSELIRLADRGQKDYCNRTRVLEEQSILTLETGRSEYPLPANWLSARLVMHNYPNSSVAGGFSRLYPSNLEKMAQEHSDFLKTSEDSQGRPKIYWIWNRSLFIYPTPSVEYATDIHLFYKALPSTLTSANNSFSVDEVLVEGILAYVLWKAWSKEKEDDLANEQKEIYAGYVGEGRRWLKKKSGDQRYRIDLDSPVGFTGSSDGFNPLS